MKLSQTIYTNLDQNDIESQYIWSLDKRAPSSRVHLVNLSTFKVNLIFPNTSLSEMYITHYIVLPNNQFFGRYIIRGLEISYLFISDENFSIKVIEANKENFFASNLFTSCFYNDSIFIFKSRRLANRYIISQNRWINIANLPPNFNPSSCTGFNQKIVIFEDSCKLLVYDIILDSYTISFPFNYIWSREQIMVKHDRKIYLIILSRMTEIYGCDNPLEKWTWIGSLNELTFDFYSYPHVYFKGSIYYLRERIVYEFSLKELQSKAVVTIKIK